MIEILEKLCCGQNTLAANVDVVILQDGSNHTQPMNMKLPLSAEAGGLVLALHSAITQSRGGAAKAPKLSRSPPYKTALHPFNGSITQATEPETCSKNFKTTPRSTPNTPNSEPNPLNPKSETRNAVHSP